MLANVDGRLTRVVQLTKGYSGSDLTAVCAEAGNSVSSLLRYASILVNLLESNLTSLTLTYLYYPLARVVTAMGPIRELGPAALLQIKADEVRSLEERDFTSAVRVARPSVSSESLAKYTEWSSQYGTLSR